MKPFRQSLKYAAALPVMLAGSAFAAVPAEVTTELSSLKTDGVEIAALVLVAVVAVFAIKFIRRGM